MRKLIFISGAACLALAACQTAPERPTTTYRVIASAEAVTPEPSAIYVTKPTYTGPRINQYGGEIPSAKPTVDVGEGGLGEVR